MEVVVRTVVEVVVELAVEVVEIMVEEETVKVEMEVEEKKKTLEKVQKVKARRVAERDHPKLQEEVDMKDPALRRVVYVVVGLEISIQAIGNVTTKMLMGQIASFDVRLVGREKAPEYVTLANG